MKNQKHLINIALGIIWVLILGGCTNATNNELISSTEASPTGESASSPKNLSYLHSYTLEIIEIKAFLEKIQAINGDIWVLRPGELIRIREEGGYKQQSYELSPSIGGDDMVFDGQSLWITSNLASEPSVLTEFDPFCPCIIGRYPIDGNIASIAYGADNIWLSISDTSEGSAIFQVKRFDTATKTSIDSIELNFFSQKIGFADGKLWAINSTDNMVSIYSAADGTLLANYVTGKTPLDIAFDNNFAWIVNRDDVYITQIPFSLTEFPISLQVSCSTFPECSLSGITIDEDLGILVYSAIAEKLYQLDRESGRTLKDYEVRVPLDFTFDGSEMWVINGDRSRNDRGRTITRIQP